MERLLNPYDKESMKMAMLHHERTFKEQVLELHRLYRIQKILMKNMRSSTNIMEANYITREQQNPPDLFDLESPVEENNMDESGDGAPEIEDEIDIELTLGPTRFRGRGKDSRPLNSDTGPSFSSSSNESSFIQRTSTHYNKRADRREDFTGHDWGLIQVPTINSSFQSGKNVYGADDNLRQERLNRPPWLFQVLSLNMT